KAETPLEKAKTRIAAITQSSKTTWRSGEAIPHKIKKGRNSSGVGARLGSLRFLPVEDELAAFGCGAVLIDVGFGNTVEAVVIVHRNDYLIVVRFCGFWYRQRPKEQPGGALRQKPVRHAVGRAQTRVDYSKSGVKDQWELRIRHPHSLASMRFFG